MSSILCLWKYKNYLKDTNEGVDEENPAYNSHQSRLHSATLLGDRAYVVTYVDGHCYLVERIIIAEKYPNEPGYKYGEFGISGNPPESQYYDFGSIDVTGILRGLSFKTGKRIGNSPRPLSLHLQTLRELTEDDVALLESCIP
jgi:hypothetical protein